MVNRVTSLVMQPAMGVGAALIAVIGQNLGSNQLDRATESFIKATKIALIIGAIGGIIMIVFNRPIVNFFIQSKDDMEVIERGITNVETFQL